MKLSWWILVLLATLLASPPGALLAAGVEDQDARADLRWRLDYDEADRIRSVRDPAGRETRLDYGFDAQQRLRRLTRTMADGTQVVRELDEEGQLTRMTDRHGTVTYGYDDLDRLNRIERTGEPAVRYAYDTQDRIVRLEIGDFYRIDYRYDFLDRLSEMDTPAGRIRYEYPAPGQVVRVLPNGLRTLWDYGAEGRLHRIMHGRAERPDSNRLLVLAEYVYAYRPDGRIARLSEQAREGELTREHQYDRAGRLIRVNGGPRPQYVYGYDAVGNRVKTLSSLQPQRAFSFDWVGRLTAIAGAPTSHDAAGNLSSLTADGATWQYRFDTENRLAEVSGSGVSYEYDGDGRLIRRDVKGRGMTFIPDPLSKAWQPLVMTPASGERSLIVWDQGAPLLMIRDGRPEYLLHDHQGSVRLIADAQGQIARRVDYEPYGIMEDPAAARDLAPRFAGMFWDPAGGVYLTRTRAYSPTLGRFLQIDSRHQVAAGTAEDLALYSYCGGDPVNFVDLIGAERTPAEIREREAAWRQRLSQVSINEDLMTMRMRQMEMQQRLRDMIERMRQQSEGVGQRQLALAEKFRDDYFFIHPRVVGITAANLFELGAAPLDGFGISVVKGMVGHVADHWRKEIGSRDATLGGALEMQANTVQQASDAVGGIMLAQDLGALASQIRIDRQLTGRTIDVLRSRFDILPGGQYTFLRDRDLYSSRIALPVDDTAELVAKMGIDQVGENLVDIAGQARRHLIGMTGHLLNFVGKGSHWIGSHRSGGDFARSWQVDSLGRLPLGDTTVGVTGSGRYQRWDEAAKWHDVQDYVNWHAPQGTEVRVPWGVDEYRYFVSRGDGSTTHDREVIGLARNASLPFPMTSAPTTANPRDMLEIKSRYPVLGMPQSTGATSVGGVYLGGAGRALSGIGLIRGLALDENQNLLLLEEGGQAIQLPPLRLDDLVTVFRSVYLHGEGPTVTIDPNPDDPEGAAMIIRHSEATAGTYVGWILFQADRLMKGYTLGVDNDTAREISTGVPGYAAVLERLYFGGQHQNRLGQGHWERFWIVPAEATRLTGERRELTLLEVPLKVKTQSMKWEGGKLVDDPSGTSSPGASAFVDWFTARYDEIAAERYLTPPPESGISEPVPVFTELRRIALMTAIAETLRDRGVPMPFWMRDYEVARVPFEEITPGLEVTRSNQRIQARVFGGVQLSAEDRTVRELTATSDLSDLTPARLARVERQLTLARELAPVARRATAAAEPLEVRRFEHAGTSFQAATVPGAATRALAPARLREVDLEVPVSAESAISLTRHYHSFFDPTGPWGRGWSLDLPRLVAIRVPVERAGDRVSYRTAYELISPLNSLYQRFFNIAPVPALGDSQLMVADETSDFFGLADAPPDLMEQPTRKLIRKDGGAWHFSQAGDLVAIEQGGFVTLYERDIQGRVTRILGLLGRRPLAAIELTYDASGRLVAASGGRRDTPNERLTLSYAYGPDGRLASVSTETGTLGYRYRGSWVSEISYRAAGDTADDKVVRRFDYDGHGRLLREWDPLSGEIDYGLRVDAAGSELSIGSGTAAATFVYDRRQRPTEARYPDGKVATWEYGDDGATTMRIAGADGGATLRITDSPDQGIRTVRLGDDYRMDARFDEDGRLTSLAENGRTLVEQEWSPDGRLRLARDEGRAEHLEYADDGLLGRVIVTPPDARGHFDRWQGTTLDPAGRPLKIEDHSGLQISIDYDEQGRLASMIEQRDGRNLGFQIARDPAGRVQRVNSSWGDETYVYDADGSLETFEARQGDAAAEAEWEQGRLIRIKPFDGGELALSYLDEGQHAGLLGAITTPDRLSLAYAYDDESRLAEVRVGDRARMRLDYDDESRLIGWGYTPVRP